MSARHKFGSGVIAAAVWLALAGGALACSCAPPPATPEEVLRTTPVIFWGRAVGIQERDGERVYSVETWAGNSPSPVSLPVKTRIESAACGVDLPLNQVVLIGGSARDGAVFINLCTKYWIDKHKPAIVEMMKSCLPFEPCPAK